MVDPHDQSQMMDSMLFKQSGH